MQITKTLQEWNRKRTARNQLSSHAGKISRQHDQKATKWIRLHRYYLHAVKSMRIKAEDIAERQRGKGFNTAIIELNQNRTAYAVYLNI